MNEVNKCCEENISAESAVGQTIDRMRREQKMEGQVEKQVRDAVIPGIGTFRTIREELRNRPVVQTRQWLHSCQRIFAG